MRRKHTRDSRLTKVQTALIFHNIIHWQACQLFFIFSLLAFLSSFHHNNLTKWWKVTREDKDFRYGGTSHNHKKGNREREEMDETTRKEETDCKSRGGIRNRVRWGWDFATQEWVSMWVSERASECLVSIRVSVSVGPVLESDLSLWLLCLSFFHYWIWSFILKQKWSVLQLSVSYIFGQNKHHWLSQKCANRWLTSPLGWKIWQTYEDYGVLEYNSY